MLLPQFRVILLQKHDYGARHTMMKSGTQIKGEWTRHLNSGVAGGGGGGGAGGGQLPTPWSDFVTISQKFINL